MLHVSSPPHGLFFHSLLLVGPLSNHKDMLVTDCIADLVMKRALSKRSPVAMALLEKSAYVMSCSQIIKEVHALVFVLLLLNCPTV